MGFGFGLSGLVGGVVCFCGCANIVLVLAGVCLGVVGLGVVAHYSINFFESIRTQQFVSKMVAWFPISSRNLTGTAPRLVELVVASYTRTQGLQLQDRTWMVGLHHRCS